MNIFGCIVMFGIIHGLIFFFIRPERTLRSRVGTNAWVAAAFFIINSVQGVRTFEDYSRGMACTIWLLAIIVAWVWLTALLPSPQEEIGYE